MKGKCIYSLEPKICHVETKVENFPNLKYYYANSLRQF